MHRRELLKILGLAAASPLVPRSARALARMGAGRRLDAIGIQLYTVRTLMDRDVEGTLAALAGIGYTQVEFAGLHGKSAKAMRAMLDRHQLTSPSTHVALEEIRGQWSRVLDEAQTLGQRYVICPWLDANQRRTLDDYRRVAEQLNSAGEVAQKAGMTLGYHNHNFEFAPIGDTIPYDVLLAECDPKLVAMELDLFWIVKGGQDPLAYIAKHPGRFALVHVKDMTKSGDMADVGKGGIDFRAIFAQSNRAGIRYYFVEHDEPPSPLDSARASYEYLRRLTF